MKTAPIRVVEPANEAPTATPRLLGYQAAAPYIGVQVGTLRSMVSRRQIPHIRISERMVRFCVEDLDQWIAERRVAVGGSR